MKYILSIDQGTTGTTACLINAEDFSFVGKVNLEYPQIYPHPSWVEHNLNDIWESVSDTVLKVLKNHNAKGADVVAIGITNQRETTCAFSKSGNPLANAIVWQDRRTSEFCQSLSKDKDLVLKIKKTTGLPIDPYFSASKMNWLLNNNPSVKEASLKNDLLFGTIDTYLLYKLTGNSSHKTDISNASRTMLMDLKSTSWDQSLLDLFQVKKDFLPQIEDSFCQFGTTKNLSFLPDGIPITGILGDQQSALFGQAGFNEGDMKCTYGTGAFLLLNTSDKLIYSQFGLLTTALFRHKGQACYALEGSSYIAGAAVQWLRDNLKIIKQSSDIEQLARQVKDLSEMKDILFFPFFSGIGSPHWNAEAKATITGLTRDTGQSHIAFACLEGIALSINDLIVAMRNDTKLSITDLKVDGGAVENDLLMSLQSSISKTTIIKPKIIETTAYGAALAAAIGANLVSLEELRNIWKMDREFHPDKNLVAYSEAKKDLWTKTLKAFYTIS